MLSDEGREVCLVIPLWHTSLKNVVLRSSAKTYSDRVSSSCKMRKQITQAARVFQASWITAKRS